MSGEDTWTVTFHVESPKGHFVEHEMSVPFPTGDIIVALDFAQRAIPKDYPDTSYRVVAMMRGDGCGIRGHLESMRPTDSI